jgi:preprotein translocase subunit YajC
VIIRAVYHSPIFMSPSFALLAVLAAPATKPGAGASPGLANLLPLVLLGAVFWFMVIKPQQRRARTHRELMSALSPGDKVVAAGGIVGTIRKVDDDVISLQVADNVTLKVDRASVSRKIEQ